MPCFRTLDVPLWDSSLMCRWSAAVAVEWFNQPHGGLPAAAVVPIQIGLNAVETLHAEASGCWRFSPKGNRPVCVPLTWARRCGTNERRLRRRSLVIE